jgi:predicted acyl esterase
VDFGAGSTLDADGGDLFARRLAWFDRYLKGKMEPDAQPPVRLFVMGGGSGRKTAQGRLDHGGHRRSETAWPIADQRLTPYYLNRHGRLSTAKPESNAEPVSYHFDPQHPVPTMGGTVTSGEPLMRGGGYDQREGPAFYGSRPPFLPVEARPDVLVLSFRGALEAFMESNRIRAVCEAASKQRNSPRPFAS